MLPSKVEYFWDGRWRDEPRPKQVASNEAPNGRKVRGKVHRETSDYCNTDIDAYGAENGGRIRNVKKRPVFVVGPDGFVGRGTWESYEPEALYKQRAPALPADMEIVMPPGSFDHATHLEMVARAAVGKQETEVSNAA